MKIYTLTTSITGYDYNTDGTITVYFNKRWNEKKQRFDYTSAIAHPALQVKPHIGKVQDIKFSDTKPYVLEYPKATEAEIETWKASQSTHKLEEATAEQEASVNMLLAMIRK